MKKPLFVLLATVFVSMIGFGITLPVLPFYVERLATAGGTPPESIALHVGLLTAVYALMQLLFAPAWGRWSDRVGRRPLLLLGITGYATAQILFGVASSLWLLYLARVIGGILSSATAPAASAYVADLTTDDDRGRGMAWLGAATNLGVIVGPAFGGMLARQDVHWSARFGHFRADSFSVPFFAAAALAFLAVPAALRWLPESLRSASLPVARTPAPTLPHLVSNVAPLLALALTAQFGLAVFEATFALHAKETLGYGPDAVGAAFIVCGLVMTIFQVGVVGRLTEKVSELSKMTIGFGIMGVSLSVLPVPRARMPVLIVVALLALGVALIAPNLASLVSKRSGRHTGAALGAQNAANSLGQAGGALFGSALFSWRMNAPYLLAGAMLATVAGALTWRARQSRSVRRTVLK